MEEGNGPELPLTATRESQFVTELTENDVLLGRGQPILNYSGNVRFRQLIQSHKEAYTSTGKHSAKHEIASKILGTIEERGGRFLRKIEDQTERDDLHIPEDVMHAWRVVDDAVKMQKVKQALREQLSKPNDPKQANPRHRKKARLSVDSEPETGRSDHGSAAAAGGTVMQNLAPQPPTTQPIIPAGADPIPLLRLSQQPTDLLPNQLLRSSTLLDRNSMLANLKQQQHLNPQVLLLLQQQQQQQQQRRQQEAMAVWQQQQQQQQRQFQPSSMLLESDQRQQIPFGNPMATALMPPNISRWTPNASLTAAAAAGLDHPGQPNSLQNAVQHYLVSQQQQLYQPQALIAPLEPAALQADDTVGETSDEAEKPKYKREESVSSDSSSTEQLRGQADPG